MARSTDDPSALTLRFKHHKTTVVLLLPASTSFADIKTELLSTLKERYPRGILSSSGRVQIPTSKDDIIFAVLKDELEPQEGWDELDTGRNDSESCSSLGVKDCAQIAFLFVDGQAEAKGKGKASRRIWDVEYPDMDSLYPDAE